MASSPHLAYGARPVSMDLARGRVLSESKPALRPNLAAGVTQAPVTDQLALAHWPVGHVIVVCGLAGGTGRSVVASLVAAALAELPWAHVRKPVALLELRPRTLSTTRRRWLAESTSTRTAEPQAARQYVPLRTRSGIALPTTLPLESSRRSYSVVVAEAPVELPSEHRMVRSDLSSTVLLVTRPDRRSLGDVAEALVWMHDHRLVHRDRVVVLVNYATGQADRGSRAASTALAVRCRAVHKLAADPKLGPMAPLPSGTALAPHLRRPISALCLDLWRTSQSTQSCELQQQEV